MLIRNDMEVRPSYDRIEIGSASIRPSLVAWMNISRAESSPSGSAVLRVEFCRDAQVIESVKEVDYRTDELRRFSGWISNT